MASTVSAAIVSWNNRDFLGRCLESLTAATEVIVVDNASTDGSADFVSTSFPQVRLIRHDSNLGFAAGVNRAAHEATGEYLLLLNPDAEATPQSVERLVELLDEQVTGGAAAGGLLSLTEDWQREFNVRRLPTYSSVAAELLLLSYLWPDNPITRSAAIAVLDETRPHAVEQPAAACLMFRRRAFLEVGGMDERFYPAWFEDVDVCKRLLEAGWTIFFVPRAAFRHIGGSSVSTLGRATMKRLFYQNLERYMSKHHGLLGRAVTKGLVVTGMGLRATGSLMRGDTESMRVFGGVFKASINGYELTDSEHAERL